MRTVLLLLSSDQFSMPLIRYLALEGKRYGWRLCIGSMFGDSHVKRIKEEKISSDLIFISITDFRQCDHAIRKSDLIIGMVPDVILTQIIDNCIIHGKDLITPSRLNPEFISRKSLAEENDILLLFECGFSPGLDHITAKKIIDNIHRKGGKITSFKTYSGSQIMDTYDDNPWRFKLTEPVSELINFGKRNNRHLIHNLHQQIPYHQLMDRSEIIHIKGLQDLVVIPEDDALYYRTAYELTEASTVVKGKLLRKGFDSLWNLIIKLGLTDTTSRVDLLNEKSFYYFLRSLLPYSAPGSAEAILRSHFNASYDEIEALKWIGFFGDDWLEGYTTITPAVILQYLLEKNLSMLPHEKDCIVMRHELEYSLKNYTHHFTSTLITQGEDQFNSATAKAIGLTTAAAAKAFLLGNIKVKGLHTPTQKETYDPILNELDDLGMSFHIEESKVSNSEVNDSINRTVFSS